jgi:chorismate mutase
MTPLEEYRKQLDVIDARLFDAIKDRVDIVRKIGEYKKANGIEIVHPEREQAILEDKKTKALKAGLDPEFIGEIYECMIQYSREIQGGSL